MKYKFLLCLIFCLGVASVVKAENAAKEKKTAEPLVKWSGFVEGGGTVQHGNTRTKQLTLGAELIRTTKKTKLLSKGFLAYGETDNVKPGTIITGSLNSIISCPENFTVTSVSKSSPTSSGI